MNQSKALDEEIITRQKKREDEEQTTVAPVLAESSLPLREEGEGEAEGEERETPPSKPKSAFAPFVRRSIVLKPRQPPPTPEAAPNRAKRKSSPDDREAQRKKPKTIYNALQCLFERGSEFYFSFHGEELSGRVVSFEENGVLSFDHVTNDYVRLSMHYKKFENLEKKEVWP